MKDYEDRVKSGELPMPSAEMISQIRPWLMGQAAGAIRDVKPAAGLFSDYMSSLDRNH